MTVQRVVELNVKQTYYLPIDSQIVNELNCQRYNDFKDATDVPKLEIHDIEQVLSRHYDDEETEEFFNATFTLTDDTKITLSQWIKDFIQMRVWGGYKAQREEHISSFYDSLVNDNEC